MKRTWLFSLGLVLAYGAAPCVAEDVDFARHIVPTLYKLGCSSGSCHGAFNGRGQLRLSLFAARPDIDYTNLRGGYNRRIDRSAADESLLLRKPSQNGVGHGGGTRMQVGSPEYELIQQWIAEGALYDPTDSLQIREVRVEPAVVTMTAGTKDTNVRVIATLSDGSSEEVTRYTTFESRDPAIAEIDAEGHVEAHRVGDIPVLAHYSGLVAYTIVEVPAPKQAASTEKRVEYADAVDRMLAEKLQRLNIVASPLCTDEEFVRRAYLDVTSTLPTPEQVLAFLNDASPEKRSALIDSLLDNPLHHAVWATKFTDMLGADNRYLDPIPFHDWFRNKLEKNVSWKQIAYGVFCGTAADERTPEQIQADLDRVREERKRKKEAEKKGAPLPVHKKEEKGKEPWQIGYGARKTMDAIYSGNKFQQQIRDKNNKTIKTILNSKQVALQLSSAFLGLQLTCAQCHKHPYDKWTEQDFYGFASVFTYLHRGVDPALQEVKVSLSGVHVQTEQTEVFPDPDTGEPLSPRTLGGDPIEVVAGIDPRKAVWEWMANEENPYFARAIVNRVWAHYMGRGLFEPIDSQSAANPASHPDVLDELSRDFVEHDYDLKRLHRRILHLAAYSRSWRTNATNASDERNYSHRTLQRMTAEQVVDSISQITGTPLELTKVYYTKEPREGARMIEMAQSRFRGNDWHVLRVFGKPLRVQACDCERGTDPSLGQVMYLYNDESLFNRLASEEGRLKKMVETTNDDKKLLESLYLWVFSRQPTEQEIARSLTYLKGADDRFVGYQDILWSLLNRQEFLVNH